MIIVNIIGGLGNQLFQYAFGYAISQKKDEVLKLDINDFEIYSLRDFELELYNINITLASKKEAKKLKYKDENIFDKVLRKIIRKDALLSNQYYREHQFDFAKNIFYGDSYFEGYWQSEKYFKEYREELLKQFTLREEIHFQSQQYREKIKSTESVSLHIRRGDYITNTHTNSVHGTCSLDYYKKAVFKIEETVESAHFFIFSDDLDWAKENLDFINNITFIELSKDIPDHEEMYLMSLCKYNIIANSSFSWWGAWLNQNPNKVVIAPSQWFNDTSRDTSDLVPEDWIRL